MTHKDYDMSELKKLLKSFSVGAATTVTIHAIHGSCASSSSSNCQLHYMTMPSSQYTFSKKDPSQNHKLKHPFVDDSPTAKLTVSSQEQTYTSQLVRTPLATGFIL
ncbi:hypothetical protein CY35_09G045000 [Sphagnum magellanicum]|nr:hypothetical protein CY35_09G045000 [Sphagnum magellanicum]KAH9552073.1 hypothetical protein CY35_09G045000 [Sphagnum magellanicum]KAH9552074.1 hypothetical protein CY35_09G045000 [Sphagnum magellanicum]KAH9552075.1 hypothetical protein CY35_09G045000 [Sphagnum magellanicum]KAH9552076.1 hypothetical protein CY35_09G045000 [Sphagnum magellanicum]